MEQLLQVKEIIATLNLESATTAGIVKEIMPILWWQFVWLPIINNVVTVVLAVTGLVLISRMFKKL